MALDTFLVTISASWMSELKYVIAFLGVARPPRFGNMTRMNKEILTRARASMSHESFACQGLMRSFPDMPSIAVGCRSSVTLLCLSCLLLHHRFPWQPLSSFSLSRPTPLASLSPPLLSLPSQPSSAKPPAPASPLSS